MLAGIIVNRLVDLLNRHKVFDTQKFPFKVNPVSCYNLFDILYLSRGSLKAADEVLVPIAVIIQIVPNQKRRKQPDSKFKNLL